MNNNIYLGIWSRLGLLIVLVVNSAVDFEIDEVLVATRVPDCDLSNHSNENTVMRFGQTKTMTMVNKL